MNNKTIVALLAVALVVSLTGTIMSVSEISKVGGQWMILSGAQITNETTGNTTLELLANVGIEVVSDTANMNIGTGYVTIGQDSATINTGTSPSNTYWKNSTGDDAAGVRMVHTINQTGSTAAILTVNIGSTTAEDFLCGGDGGCAGTDVAQVKVKVDADTHSTCITGEQTSYALIANATDKVSDVQLCSEFLPAGTGDSELDIAFELTVPSDAPTGVKSTTFTYTAEEFTG